MVGALPNGLPAFAMPTIDLGVITTLIPTALSIALVILAQSSAVIRSLANEHDEKVKLNQDLTSLGIANAISALTHGFAVNGSPPRSVAADSAGGRTGLVNVLMGVFIGALLLFGGNLLTDMPHAALASIVFMLGWHLIRVHELRYIWSTHKMEFAVAMIALVGTALFGVYQGVVIAVIVSLMERLSRQYHPKDDILLRDGELSEWAAERLDWHHHRHRTRPHGLMIYAFDGSLFFENVNYFVARIKAAIEQSKEPVEYVLVDAGAIDSIDYTAVEMMKTLYRQLSSEDIQMGFAHVSPNLRHQFDAFGVSDLVGKDNIFSTLSGAIKMHPGSKRSAVEMVHRLGLKRGSFVVIGGAVLEVLNLRETSDVDLVVSDEVYEHYRDEKKWAEYVQDNGKKVLSHDGYNMMHTWMGNSLKHLQHHSFEIEKIAFMGVEELIEAKRHLGRKKDLEDIMLLEGYQETPTEKTI